MSAPLHARDVKGKGRWYGRCDQPDCPFGDSLYISVTNAQDIVNKPALPPSAAKITAAAAYDRLPQMIRTSREVGPWPCEKKRVAERCGKCRFCVTAAIKAEYRNQWETKRDLGTALHIAAHAHNIGQPHTPSPEVMPFFDTYLRFLREWGVDMDKDIMAAETTILSKRDGYAGTGDLWIWLKTGPRGERELWLLDAKTSLDKPASTVYDDQILQLGGLRYAPVAVLNDDTIVRVPKFAKVGLLNLRPSSYAVIPLPADRAAHAAFVSAVRLRHYMLDCDSGSWKPLPTPLRKVS